MRTIKNKPKIDKYIERFFELNRGVFRRLRSYSIYQFVKHHFTSRSKVLVKNLQCTPLSKSQIREIKEYYASFGFKNINTEWHRFYTHVSGKFYKEYIPVEFFINVIEPTLNNGMMKNSLIDKNLLEKLFDNIRQPETIVKNINGYFLDPKNQNILTLKQVIEKCNNYSKLLIKPSIESGGGKDITVFELKEENSDYMNRSIEEIINSYNRNFIIQNYFIQHKEMSDLNPSSVNTLRIQTLLIRNKIEILRSVVRIGGNGSVIDNGASGGWACAVNKKGFLNKMGFKGTGILANETDRNVKFEGKRIPNFINIIEEVKNIHLQIPYFRIIAWDIAIDKKGKAVLIEFNLAGQGIHPQFATGPFFGRFTDEILSECKVNMFS